MGPFSEVKGERDTSSAAWRVAAQGFKVLKGSLHSAECTEGAVWKSYLVAPRLKACSPLGTEYRQSTETHEPPKGGVSVRSVERTGAFQRGKGVKCPL